MGIYWPKRSDFQFILISVDIHSWIICEVFKLQKENIYDQSTYDVVRK